MVLQSLQQKPYIKAFPIDGGPEVGLSLPHYLSPEPLALSADAHYSVEPVEDLSDLNIPGPVDRVSPHILGALLEVVLQDVLGGTGNNF